MRLGRRGFLLGVGAAIGAWHDGVARADLDDGLLRRIAAARAPVRTLQGPFTQTRTLGLLSTAVRSSGTMTLLRPDRLRWDLSPPDDVTFFLGPEGLAYRSAQGKGILPASAQQVGSALEDLRTVLGGDLSDLRRRWDLLALHDDPTGAEIEATPRAGATGHVKSIRFALGPGLALPTRVVLVEGPRDKTLIEFGTLVVNAPVDEGKMRFSP
jgi:hypothetical protein